MKQLKRLNTKIIQYLREHPLTDLYIQDQLKRASISMVINIAEGSGRYTSPGRRHFYIIARSSVYECVSLVQILHRVGDITTSELKAYYVSFEEISKMLFALIKSQKNPRSTTHY